MFDDDVTRTSSESPEGRASLPLPTQIGRYRILRLIGAGGMGTVYEAEQENPRRIVALKVIRPGVVTVNLLRRFEQESQVLGRLQHPGIAQIYEAGTADSGYGPQPYFAMELVNGRRLDAYVAEKQLSTHQRLELLARVCDAVEHAHQKGIIHRDLKPENFVVDESGQPKILDFGVARATDSDVHATMHTAVGAMVGTLPYMSPEQVGPDPADLDTRSDVYALGVVLFELLSGRLPYNLDRKTLPEAVRIIREEEPGRLTLVNRTFRGDVETIASKALSKERERRYQSAADLAADIRRYLRHEPIVARPTSTAYQLRKFAIRNRALVGGLSAVFVVLVLGIVVSVLQAQRARKETAKAEAVNAFLQEMLSSVDPSQLKGRDVTVRQLLDEAAKKVGDGSLKNQPEIEASVRTTLGKTYQALGLYPDAEPHLRAALEIRKRTRSAGDPQLAESLNSLASLLHDRGDLAGAEPLYREALAIRRKALGEEDPSVAGTLNDLALLLKNRGDLAGAEPMYREALAIYRKYPDSKLPELAQTQNNLALLLQARGDLVGPEPLLRESLALRRKILGNEHPEVAQGLGNLASLLIARGDLASAEPLCRESLAIRRKVLGNEHPDVAVNLNNLGRVLQGRGELAEAEPMFKEALAIWRKALGDEHPQVAQGLNNLAMLLAERGDPSGAEPLFRESLAIRRKVRGNEHPDVGQALITFGRFLQDQGDLAEAEPMDREALAIYRKALGDEHPSVASCLSTLGSLLVDKGDPAGAEPLAREGLDIRVKKLPARHPNIAASQAILGLCLIRLGRPAEAEPLLTEALSIRDEKLPPGSWARPDTRSVLGEALAGQRKFEQAEPLLLEAYKGIKDDKAAPAIRKREAFDRIGRLYAAWGRPDKAAAWRRASK